MNKQEEQIAFFCDRPVQIFNALNFVFHDALGTKGKADIYIFSQFSSAGKLAEKIRATGVFQNVFLDQEDTDKHYTIIFTPAWGCKLWETLAKRDSKNCEIYFYDDGFLSYIKSNITALHADSWEAKIRKFFHHGKFGLHIDGIYLNNPSMCRYDRSNVFKLPPISNKDSNFTAIAETIFGVPDKITPYLFVEQNLNMKIPVDVDELRSEILEIICKNIPKIDFSVRLHPVQKYYQPLKNQEVAISSNDALWEMICAYDCLTDKNVLLGFSSTALVILKLCFAKEPTVICLYRLLKWENKKLLQDTEDFFQQMAASYRDRSKFHIVNDLKELEQILQQLRLKKNK